MLNQFQLMSAEDIEEDRLRSYAWVTAIGVVKNADNGNGTFDIDISQYVSAMKNLDANRLIPIRARYDLTSSRYKKPPTTRDGRFVCVTGFLSRVIKVENGNIVRFVVDVENVTFCGQAPPPTASAAQPSTSGESLNFINFFGCAHKFLSHRRQARSKT
jgi:hypothetical protein